MKTLELIKQRLNTCTKCSQLSPGLVTTLCKKCGCVIQLKAIIPAETCPEGKW